jgi:acetyltransferase-like isoleucine patch superfamily enzyme
MLFGLARTLKRTAIRRLHARLQIERLADVERHNSEWRKKLKQCGVGLHVNGKIEMSGERNVEIGSNVHIGNNAFIRGNGGLVIGDNTHISRNLVLYTVNHQYEGKLLPYDNQQVAKPVVIGRNVWIGMNVCIAPGTKIGDGAIIGMGAVVSGEVPPLSIVGNQKFRILGYRDPGHYEQLDKSEAYGGVNGKELRTANN